MEDLEDDIEKFTNPQADLETKYGEWKNGLTNDVRKLIA